MYRVDYWSPGYGNKSKEGFTSYGAARSWAVTLPPSIVWSIEPDD